MTSDDLSEDFRRYRSSGDRQLRNSLVERHVHLVEVHVRHYQGSGVPTDDLRQVGLLAMLRAVERFDPEVGVLFSTFAGQTIDGELKRYLRDRSWSVRPPRRYQELHLVARRTEEDLVQSLGRAPTVSEIAQAMGESEDLMLEIMEVGGARNAFSLDKPFQRNQGSSGSATLDQTGTYDQLGMTDQGYSKIEIRAVVQRLLDALDDREREVIALCFFEEMGQSDIAERLGLSQSYVSRLIRRIIASMRAEFDMSDLDIV